MRKTPVNYDIVNEQIKACNIPTVGKASIREIKKLVDMIEGASGVKYVRMEMGVPGLPPASFGTKAEIEALNRGVGAIYPDIQGIPEIKKEMKLFVKNFIGLDVNEEGCLPTVGSMQGCFGAFMTLDRSDAKKDTTLFLDPGFPVHKQQLRVLGQKFESFDVYNYRGEKLRTKLESYLSKGNVHSMLYSNPNNPSWICFTETELKIIAELSIKYDVVVLEDLAYFGMDFRVDISTPGQPPYQPSVANYCDNYILFISSSKAFSYAGQRCGMMVISNKLFNREFPDLKRFYNSTRFGRAMVFGTIYSLSSGVTHSAQYGVAAILKAANEGKFNFVEETKEYGEKAKIMKKLFTDNGFKIVYDMDEDKPIADGFYFTISYPGMSGEELISELIYYGISAITLGITGSERTEGLRACVSLVSRNQFPALEERLKLFKVDHPIG